MAKYRLATPGTKCVGRCGTRRPAVHVVASKALCGFCSLVSYGEQKAQYREWLKVTKTTTSSERR